MMNPLTEAIEANYLGSLTRPAHDIIEDGWSVYCALTENPLPPSSPKSAYLDFCPGNCTRYKTLITHLPATLAQDNGLGEIAVLIENMHTGGSFALDSPISVGYVETKLRLGHPDAVVIALLLETVRVSLVADRDYEDTSAPVIDDATTAQMLQP